MVRLKKGHICEYSPAQHDRYCTVLQAAKSRRSHPPDTVTRQDNNASVRAVIGERLRSSTLLSFVCVTGYPNELLRPLDYRCRRPKRPGARLPLAGKFRDRVEPRGTGSIAGRHCLEADEAKSLASSSRKSGSKTDKPLWKMKQ